MALFFQRIEAIKSARNLNVAEVLALLEISPAMFSMIRSGKRKPSVKTIRRIEQAEIESGLRLPPMHSPPLADFHSIDSELDTALVAAIQEIQAMVRLFGRFATDVKNDLREIKSELQTIRAASKQNSKKHGGPS